MRRSLRGGRLERAREWEIEQSKANDAGDESTESAPTTAPLPPNPHHQAAVYPTEIFTTHTVHSFTAALFAEGRLAASPAVIAAAETALADLEKKMNKKAGQRPQANQSNVMAMIIGALSGAVAITDLANLRFDGLGSDTNAAEEDEDIPGTFGGSKKKSFRVLEKGNLGPFLWEGESPRMARRPMMSMNPGGTGFSVVM